MSSLSLKLLGSKELQEQVLEDMDELFSQAKIKSLKPIFVVIGPLFIEIATIQALIQENNITDWDKRIEAYPEIITEVIKHKKISIYYTCEEDNGVFSQEEGRNIKIYFDPEEDYISLTCVDPSKKAAKGDMQTKDGYSYRHLRFKKSDVLPNFFFPEGN